MNDMNERSLLQEIEDDLARQKAEKFWKTYWPYVLGAALAIVLATAGVSAYKSYRLSSAQKAASTYLSIMDKNKDKEAELAQALDAYTKTNDGTIQYTLAQFTEAGLALEQNKKDKALAIYNEIAADKAVETKFRQLADLLYVQTELDTGDIAALDARLQPLMDGSPWQFSAREFAGNLAIRAGDKEKAIRIFSDLKVLPHVPKSIEARSKDILNWLKEGA